MNTRDKENRKTATIAVIGGGPAGLMASISARQQDTARVILFEKNAEPGRKLLLTGNGRCNVTNDSEVRDFTGHVFEGAKFLRKALHAFPPSETIAFFRDAEVPLKTEEAGRVFPVSDKASDIRAALLQTAEALGVEIRRNEAVSQILTHHEKPGFDIVTTRSSYHSDACILCAGGSVYPLTGSDGDGIRLAGAAGHTIIPAHAGLSPVKLSLPDIKELAGLSLRGIQLRLLIGGVKQARTEGDILFTHTGLSGPAVLRLSRFLPLDRILYQQGHVELMLTVMPEMPEEKFAGYVLSLVTENANRMLINVLKELAPEAYVSFLVARTGIPVRIFCRDLKREERQEMIRALRYAKFSVKSPPELSQAMVTVGGVATSQINPATMESKLVPGLYIAGETLDVDADTGGYNLQIAFSTGYAAGKNAAKMLEEKS